MSNKYNYVTVIQGNYGSYGWEDVSEYEGAYRDVEARKDIKEYRLGDPHNPHRIIHRRELNQ